MPPQVPSIIMPPVLRVPDTSAAVDVASDHRGRTSTESVERPAYACLSEALEDLEGQLNGRILQEFPIALKRALEESLLPGPADINKPLPREDTPPRHGSPIGDTGSEESDEESGTSSGPSEWSSDSDSRPETDSESESEGECESDSEDEYGPVRKGEHDTGSETQGSLHAPSLWSPRLRSLSVASDDGADANFTGGVDTEDTDSVEGTDSGDSDYVPSPKRKGKTTTRKSKSGAKGLRPLLPTASTGRIANAAQPNARAGPSTARLHAPPPPSAEVIYVPDSDEEADARLQSSLKAPLRRGRRILGPNRAGEDMLGGGEDGVEKENRGRLRRV